MKRMFHNRRVRNIEDISNYAIDKYLRVGSL